MPEFPSAAVRDFRGRPLPEPARPAGYAALMEGFALQVPLPPQLTAVAERRHPESTAHWQLLSSHTRPEPTLWAHLEFALKHEGVNLSVLSALFRVVEPEELAEPIRQRPTGIYSRRIWFLYEWLTDEVLDGPDPGKVRAVPVLDPEQQFALANGELSSRHKVINNLPGVREFCPLVRRTPRLTGYMERRLDVKAREVAGRTHPDVLARAAAFLLLSDSRSSFWIEGERPTPQRAARWGKVIGEAGRYALSPEELERLQRIVIGDDRFVRLGFRTEGGFVGMHDRVTGEPLPDHISARPEDLPSLVQGVIACEERGTAGGMEPVILAAMAAFGFVSIHPFEDGNGRLHRYLIHHVLARAGYNPPGVVFPVSAAILREIDAYRAVLESCSGAMLPLIDWVPTPRGNVEVRNETADLYRYFDATPHAEFLYECVAQTVERDLPSEVRFLQAFDRFAGRVQSVVDMPDRVVDLLHRFLRQGEGRLSLRARKQEFAALSEAEVERIEAIYRESQGEE